MIADKLQYMRATRQLRLMQRLEEFVVQEGLQDKVHSIPMKTAIPLLQAASLEENDTLQDLYASLLTNIVSNAQNEDDYTRNYVSIIEQFTPSMALLFQLLYKYELEEAHNFKWTNEDIERHLYLNTKLSDQFDLTDDCSKIQIVISELGRLNCLTYDHVTMITDPNIAMHCIRPTVFGKRLFIASTLPSHLQKN